jgi:hypothetical protein
MALATVIAGGYTATYAAAAMGQQEDGFRLRLSFAKEEIRSNTYGDSVIDAVYRGGNCFLTGIFIERASVAANAAISPWNPYGAALGFMGIVGRLDFALSVSVVMTAIATLPAASAIATLTATNSIIDQNLSTEMSFANRASFLQLTFRLYPYLSTDVKWFQVT